MTVTDLLVIPDLVNLVGSYETRKVAFERLSQTQRILDIYTNSTTKKI
ncbi:hypothetical protein V7122_17330 [Bacillus sp. JJ1532]